MATMDRENQSPIHKDSMTMTGGSMAHPVSQTQPGKEREGDGNEEGGPRGGELRDTSDHGGDGKAEHNGRTQVPTQLPVVPRKCDAAREKECLEGDDET